MRRLRLCLIVGAISLLVACGGGSSSQSGAGGVKAATPYAGHYVGFESLQMSGPGGVFPVGTFPLTIDIAADGGVLVTDVDLIPYLGTLGGVTGELLPNQFIATAFVAIPTPPDIVCQPATFGYIGTVEMDTVTGTATGSFLCSRQGTSATLVLSGPFTATRSTTIAPAPQPSIGGNLPQDPGANRRSHKQKVITDGVRSVY